MIAIVICATDYYADAFPPILVNKIITIIITI